MIGHLKPRIKKNQVYLSNGIEALRISTAGPFLRSASTGGNTLKSDQHITLNQSECSVGNAKEPELLGTAAIAVAFGWSPNEKPTFTYGGRRNAAHVSAPSDFKIAKASMKP